MGKEKRPQKSELLPGTLEMLILKDAPQPSRSDARLWHRLVSQTDLRRVLQVEEGSLYPALQRLAIKGWVKTEWGQSDNNRRARFYKLTPEGRKQLKQEVADFERLLTAILRVIQPA
jgi:transcriptional regulator